MLIFCLNLDNNGTSKNATSAKVEKNGLGSGATVVVYSPIRSSSLSGTCG